MRIIDFDRVVVLDSEFRYDVCGRPVPVCVVAHDLAARTVHRLWTDSLSLLRRPPFATGPDTLCVAYSAQSEWRCFLELGWPLPTNIVDLYAEFKGLTNGLNNPFGHSLLGAAAWFSLNRMEDAHKVLMRDRILEGPPYSPDERRAILDYCEQDVSITAAVFERLAPRIDIRHALIRGTYTAAVARIEQCGVPVNSALVDRLKSVGNDLTAGLKDASRFHEDGHFKIGLLADYVESHYRDWPRTAYGAVKYDDDTLSVYAAFDPNIASLKELLKALSQLRGDGIAAGPDGRSRTSLRPFSSKTGRNQPSTTRFVFGAAKWNRRFIQPQAGMSVAYVDWCAQELGIAAALSQDDRMMRMYLEDDPYLSFAEMASAVPPNATKASHPIERALYKTCALGVIYSMGWRTLAQRSRMREAEARALLVLHRQFCPHFWKWSERVVNHARLDGVLRTSFGWPFHVSTETSETTIRNFPMQANAAEMMRLACIIATDSGVQLCAPVHDGFLIEAPTPELGDSIALMRSAMDMASGLVLDGFVLRSEVEARVDGPNFFPVSGAAEQTWTSVAAFLGEVA